MSFEYVKTMSQYFYDTCEQFPDKLAQKFNVALFQGDNNGSFTYAQLQDRVESIACALIDLGLKKGERAGLMAATSHIWTQVDIALASCGVASVTIYPTLSNNEVIYIMNDSASRFLFLGSASLLKQVKPVMDQIPGVEKLIIMDPTFRSESESILGLYDLIEKGAELKKDAAILKTYEEQRKSLTLDDWFTILYTSGTTGLGKGVVITNWSAASRLEGTRDYFHEYEMDITEEDLTLCYLPLSHVFDRGSCQWLGLREGACICYADKPATLVDDMQKYNPTWINCVPRLYEKIYVTIKDQMAASAVKQKLFNWAMKVGYQALEYRKDENDCYDMRSNLKFTSRMPLGLRIKFKVADTIIFKKVRGLFGKNFRHSFSASASISPDLLKFYYAVGIAVVEGYGSTESFNAALLNPLTACKPGYMGKNANGSISRVAEDGELELSGAGIFKEYLNKPEDTESSFTPDGWFITGDVVEQSPDGYYKFVERKKAIICTAVGKNIAPVKLENLFSTSSVVEQIFFIGDERNYISALVVPSFAYFMELYDRENITYDRDAVVYGDIGGMQICVEVGEDFVNQERMKELIDKEIQEVNKKLERFEQVRKYTILRRRFTEDNEMMTPTQKPKKRVIIDVYKDAIEDMYR